MEQLAGLRLFLYGVLNLIKKNKKESCTFIEESISDGIATALYIKYKNAFDTDGFCMDNCEIVDEYYRQRSGIADGLESKYRCDEEDGLFLLIKLALNDIF